jgi:hypothetical protein
MESKKLKKKEKQINRQEGENRTTPVEFSSLCHSHKLSRSWLLGTRPRSHQSLSGLPGLFIYNSGKDSLPPIFSAQCAPPSFPCVFIFLIAY